MKVLSEILDHVVALELAVDENVQTDGFLPGDDVVDLAPDEIVIRRLIYLSLAQSCTFRADLSRLREGPDGRRRQKRQSQLLALKPLPFASVREPDQIVVGQIGEAAGHRGIRRDAASVEQRLVVMKNRRSATRVIGGIDEIGDLTQLDELLLGEREMAEHILPQGVLALRRVGDVQQGACGGHRDVIGHRAQRVDQAQTVGVVVSPDVAAIDHSGDDGGGLRDAVTLDRGEGPLPSFDEVKAQIMQRLSQLQLQKFQQELRDKAKTDYKFGQ